MEVRLDAEVADVFRVKREIKINCHSNHNKFHNSQLNPKSLQKKLSQKFVKICLRCNRQRIEEILPRFGHDLNNLIYTDNNIRNHSGFDEETPSDIRPGSGLTEITNKKRGNVKGQFGEGGQLTPNGKDCGHSGVDCSIMERVLSLRDFSVLDEYVKQLCLSGTLEQLMQLTDVIKKESCFWIPTEIYNEISSNKNIIPETKIDDLSHPSPLPHSTTRSEYSIASADNFTKYNLSPSSSSTSPSSSSVSDFIASVPPHSNNTLSSSRNNKPLSSSFSTNPHQKHKQPQCLCRTHIIHPDWLNSNNHFKLHHIQLNTIVIGDTNNTILSWAAYYGRFEFIEFLLKHHTSLNTITQQPNIYIANLATVNNETCLAFAAARGFLRIVKLLLENNANPNPQVDWNGGTPLLYAVQQAYPGIVGELILKGARIIDCGDYDAYELAILLEHQQCADVIEKCMADAIST